MGGPLTANDLQTHQHASECQSRALVASPLSACFVLTCTLDVTVTPGGSPDHKQLSCLTSSALLSQKTTLGNVSST